MVPVEIVGVPFEGVDIVCEVGDGVPVIGGAGDVSGMPSAHWALSNGGGDDVLINGGSGESGIPMSLHGLVVVGAVTVGEPVPVDKVGVIEDDEELCVVVSSSDLGGQSSP